MKLKTKSKVSKTSLQNGSDKPQKKAKNLVALSPTKNPKKTKLKVKSDDVNTKKAHLAINKKRKVPIAPPAKKKNENHKSSLNKLKEIDPEFYKFLEQNDQKLLKFNADENDESDESDAKSENEADYSDSEDVHKPATALDAASDESDFEDPDDDDDNEIDSDNDEVATKPRPGTAQLVTLKMLKNWQKELSLDKVSVDTIKNVIEAVNSALVSISGDKPAKSLYKVEGAAVFNGILQLCLLHIYPAVKRFLGLAGRTSKKPHHCKKWNKIRNPLRNYLTDLTNLFEHVTSPNIVIALLKHLHQISDMMASFTVLTKPILKRLVVMWSTAGDETIRVLAFLCILKIVRGQQITLLNTILKAMYLAYVRNAKFVSPGTLPGINFMRRSLVEMFALDLNVSYQHVFLYIRQLAIHLRNALTLKKKESLTAVYNWQFINSMRLWTELLSATYNRVQLQPLVFPLVSICTGVIKLIPTAQYFPLRFHCVQMLIQLSKETRCFVPVMPFILEVLNSNTFNKKHSKVSMKPLQFTCILRLNKGQLLENGFRDEVVEQIFGLTLDHMAHESFTISYPDLAVPSIITLKQYVKRCKNSNYSKKLKQLCDKLMESAKVVEGERAKCTFTLKDSQLIAAWESKMQNKGTPLLTFYESWSKTNMRVKKRSAVGTDEISDFNLPTIDRSKRAKRPRDDGPLELFPSDDEDGGTMLDKDESRGGEAKGKTRKAKERRVEPIEEDDDDDDDDADMGIDIVKDLDLDDW